MAIASHVGLIANRRRLGRAFVRVNYGIGYSIVCLGVDGARKSATILVSDFVYVLCD